MTTVCLTLDIDWAADALVRDALALVEAHGVKATWFATHTTSVLDEIRAAGSHEIGLHPNFMPLLSGAQSGNPETVLSALQVIAPEATAVRSHSLVSSSRLSLMFAARGFTHESNVLIPAGCDSDVMPWRSFDGLVQTPIRWEDDIRLVDTSFGEPVDWLGEVRLLTVDFHPIHLFLNTTSVADYEAAREDFSDPTRLLARRRPPGSGGSRDRLEALLSNAKSWTLMRDLRPERV